MAVKIIKKPVKIIKKPVKNIKKPVKNIKKPVKNIKKLVKNNKKKGAGKIKNFIKKIIPLRFFNSRIKKMVENYYTPAILMSIDGSERVENEINKYIFTYINENNTRKIAKAIGYINNYTIEYVNRKMSLGQVSYSNYKSLRIINIKEEYFKNKIFKEVFLFYMRNIDKYVNYKFLFQNIDINKFYANFETFTKNYDKNNFKNIIDVLSYIKTNYPKSQNLRNPVFRDPTVSDPTVRGQVVRGQTDRGQVVRGKAQSSFKELENPINKPRTSGPRTSGPRTSGPRTSKKEQENPGLFYKRYLNSADILNKKKKPEPEPEPRPKSEFESINDLQNIITELIKIKRNKKANNYLYNSDMISNEIENYSKFESIVKELFKEKDLYDETFKLTKEKESFLRLYLKYYSYFDLNDYNDNNILYYMFNSKVIKLVDINYLIYQNNDNSKYIINILNNFCYLQSNIYNPFANMTIILFNNIFTCNIKLYEAKYYENKWYKINKILNYTKNLVYKNVSPHFMITHFSYPNVFFEYDKKSKIIKLLKDKCHHKNDKEYYIRINEGVQCNLDTFISEIGDNLEYHKSILMQVFMACFTFHFTTGLYINNLNLNNILINKTKFNYFKYNIESKSLGEDDNSILYVKTYGYRVMISDFDYCNSNYVIYNKKNKEEVVEKDDDYKEDKKDEEEDDGEEKHEENYYDMYHKYFEFKVVYDSYINKLKGYPKIYDELTKYFNDFHEIAKKIHKYIKSRQHSKCKFAKKSLIIQCFEKEYIKKLLRTKTELKNISDDYEFIKEFTIDNINLDEKIDIDKTKYFNMFDYFPNFRQTSRTSRTSAPVVKRPDSTEKNSKLTPKAASVMINKPKSNVPKVLSVRKKSI